MCTYKESLADFEKGHFIVCKSWSKFWPSTSETSISQSRSKEALMHDIEIKFLHIIGTFQKRLRAKCRQMHQFTWPSSQDRTPIEAGASGRNAETAEKMNAETS